MTTRPKIRNAALGAALAAVAASAWAAGSSWSPAESFYPGARPVAMTPAPAPAATPPQPIAVEDSLSPNETIVTDEEVRATRIEHAKARAPLIVEERRLSEDERIQSVVMDALARDARLTGKIGVESHASVVRLTGWTTTVGQAERAGRMARGVTGVRYVENLIRPRVGGMVSS
jgi:hypothetical protein